MEKLKKKNLDKIKIKIVKFFFCTKFKFINANTLKLLIYSHNSSVRPNL